MDARIAGEAGEGDREGIRAEEPRWTLAQLAESTFNVRSLPSPPRTRPPRDESVAVGAMPSLSASPSSSPPLSPWTQPSKCGLVEEAVARATRGGDGEETRHPPLPPQRTGGRPQRIQRRRVATRSLSPLPRYRSSTTDLSEGHRRHHPLQHRHAATTRSSTVSLGKGRQEMDRAVLNPLSTIAKSSSSPSLPPESNMVSALARLEYEHAMALERLEARTKQVKDLRGVVERKERDLRAATKKLEIMTTQTQTLQEQLRKKEEYAARLEAKLAVGGGKTPILLRKVASLQKQLEEERHEKKALMGTLMGEAVVSEEQRQYITALRQVICTGRIGEAPVAPASMKTLVEEKIDKGFSDAHREHVQRLEEEKQALLDFVEEVTNRAEAAEERVLQLEGAPRLAEGRVESLEHILQEERRRCTREEERTQRCEMKMEESERAFKELRESKADVEASLAATRARVLALEERLVVVQRQPPPVAAAVVETDTNSSREISALVKRNGLLESELANLHEVVREQAIFVSDVEGRLKALGERHHDDSEARCVLENTIAELKNELSVVRKRFSQIHEEKNASAVQIAHLCQERDRLVEENAELARRIDLGLEPQKDRRAGETGETERLQWEKERLEGEIRLAHQAKQQAEAQKTTLEKDKSLHEMALGEAQRKTTETEARLQDALRRSAQHERSITDLEEKLDQMRRLHREAQCAIEEEKSLAAKVTRENGALDRQIMDLNEENALLRRKASGASDGYSDRLLALESEKTKVEHMLRRVQESLHLSESSRKEIERELYEVKRGYADVEQVVSRQNQEVNAVRLEVEEYKIRLCEKERTVETLQGALQTSKMMLDTISAQFRDAKEEISSYRSKEVATLESMGKVAVLQARLEDVSRELAERKANGGGTVEEGKRTAVEDLLKGSLERMTEEAERRRQEVDKRNSELIDQITKMRITQQKETDKFKKKVHGLEQEISVLRCEKDASQRLCDDLTKKVSDLQAEIARMESEQSTQEKEQAVDVKPLPPTPTPPSPPPSPPVVDQCRTETEVDQLVKKNEELSMVMTAFRSQVARVCGLEVDAEGPHDEGSHEEFILAALHGMRRHLQETNQELMQKSVQLREVLHKNQDNEILIHKAKTDLDDTRMDRFTDPSAQKPIEELRLARSLLEEKRNAERTLQDTVRRVEDENAELRVDNESLREKAFRLEELQQSLRDDLAAGLQDAEDGIAELTTIRELYQMAHTLEEEKGALQKSAGIFRREVSSLKAIVESKESVIRELQGECQERREAIRRLQSLLESNDNQLVGKLRSMEDECAQKEKEITALQGKVDLVQRADHEALEKIQEAQATVRARERDITELKQQLESARQRESDAVEVLRQEREKHAVTPRPETLEHQLFRDKRLAVGLEHVCGILLEEARALISSRTLPLAESKPSIDQVGQVSPSRSPSKSKRALSLTPLKRALQLRPTHENRLGGGISSSGPRTRVVPNGPDFDPPSTVSTQPNRVRVPVAICGEGGPSHESTRDHPIVASVTRHAVPRCIM